MTHQGLYGQPTRRPSTPVPPLPNYGGHRPPPVPNRPAAYQPPPAAWPQDDRLDDGWAPRQDAGYDDRYEHQYDDRYDHGWSPEPEYDGYDDYEAYDAGPARTNTMAVLGLVFAFVFSPLGLIFSAIGLGQTKRRHERGRGLAIAGLVLSIVFIAIGIALTVIVFLGVGKALEATATGQSAAVPPAPGAAAEPGSVLAACQTMMPALLNSEQQMSTATAPEQVGQALASLRASLDQAAAGTGDAAFIQHVQQLSGSLQQLESAISTGQLPPDIMTTMTDQSYAVGQDCGLAGWTP